VGIDGTHTSVTDTGCREVHFVATGMLMISRKVFEKMLPPWFHTTEELKDGKLRYVGNDANFCFDAQKAGFKVWCDFFTSRKVSHIGSYPLSYVMDHPPEPTNEDTLPRG
jgi:hypothetical protein